MKRNQKLQLLGALSNGSLEEGTRKLFLDSHMPILSKSRQHDARVDSPFISGVTWMRPFHVSRLVEKGYYDFGICGTDCVEETGADVERLAELAYGRGNSTGRTRVVLFADEKEKRPIRELVKKGPVLTEYPNITRKEFKRLGLRAQLEFSYGGTEAHIPKHNPLGVCLSDSGESLEANHKKVVSVLLNSCTMLIANRRAWKEKRGLLIALKHSLVGTLEARHSVFVVMNVLARKKKWVLKQLPALKKPTVTKLSDPNYFSVGTVIRKDDINSLMPRLLQNGVTGWVEMPITRVVQSW